MIEADEKGITIDERRVPYNMDEFIKKFKESDQYKKVPVWSNIRIRELQARREHLYFFLKYAEEYAEHTGDPVRPFTRKTWEAAYKEWEKR